MKVVLLENVENLGIVGDKKNVAPGYARNYLLPKKLVAKVGSKEAKILLKNITKKRDKIKKEVRKLEKIAKEYEGKEIKFQLKASAKGKLFGSVGTADVAKKLKISQKQIDFSPIKEVGKHKVKVNLGHNIKTQIKIIIEKLKNKKK